MKSNQTSPSNVVIARMVDQALELAVTTSTSTSTPAPLPLSWRCIDCQSSNAVGDRFCVKCGSAQLQPQPQPQPPPPCDVAVDIGNTGAAFGTASALLTTSAAATSAMAGPAGSALVLATGTGHTAPSLIGSVSLSPHHHQQQVQAPPEKRLSSYREHHADSVAQVSFCGLSFTVPVEVDKIATTKQILKSVDGVFQAARFTAVMGPSGSGKTSLLNAVSGWCPKDRLSGELFVNGTMMTSEDIKQMSCFVQQDDVLLETMTVRETITMSALLRLPNTMSASQKHIRVDELIELLHLNKCADSIIGSATIKGISGGERKRVAIAMEMITNPSVLFLDEPTSGLDTFTAFSVIDTLTELAHKGHTVVATIHQPSSDMYHMFDDLLLLAEGEVLYYGDAMEAIGYFDRQGFPCPQYSNPADHMFMNVLNSTPELSDSSFFADVAASTLIADPATTELRDVVMSAAAAPQPQPSVEVAVQPSMTTISTIVPMIHAPLAVTVEPGAIIEPAAGDRIVVEQTSSKLDVAIRIQSLLAQWKQGKEYQKVKRLLSSFAGSGPDVVKRSTTLHCHAPSASLGFVDQFLLLSGRAWRNQRRHPMMMQAQFGQAVAFGLICGLVWLQLSLNQQGIQDRSGSLFFLVVNAVMTSCSNVLTIFANEKAVFRREYGARMYSLPAYFVSKVVMEWPALCVFPFLQVVIVYWMLGYQNDPSKFLLQVITVILTNNCGNALGIMCACLFADVAVALAVVPLFLMPLMIFCGFIINSASIPVWFDWIKWLSPMKYGFVSLCKIEFEGLRFHCTDSQMLGPVGGKYCPVIFGSDVITRLGFDDQGSVALNLILLVVLYVGTLGAALLALKRSVKAATR